jgi:2-polyprenyl-3-methyl-5-hydroxy-6-metoxy-1,4-benzoquinol methylase
MTLVDPTSRQFFEQKYRAHADPWSFASDGYEQWRYGVLVQHVEAGRYARAFEPGCSVGVLTDILADRCGHVFATDIADTAVAVARRRCGARSNVTIQQGSLAGDLPAGPFDLIVISEVGYYFDEPTLGRIAGRLGRMLDPSGLLLAAHWTGESDDHVLAGPRVHNLLDAHLGLRRVTHTEYSDALRGDGFVLDTWRAAPGQAAR